MRTVQLSVDLHTDAGERKYLTADEIERFTAAASSHERGEVRTFCLVLAYTGCRLTEALELTARHVDLQRKTLTFRTLKQRRTVRHRDVPIPAALLDALELVHRIRRQRRRIAAVHSAPRLWSWGRTQAYQHVKAAMRAAGIEGPHATPKGLRHGFGVRAATATRQPRLVQKWLGHRSLDTTAIYMDARDEEERELARRMWG